MTAGHLVPLDLGAALLATGAWIGAGAASVARRSVAAAGLTILGVVATAARIWVAAALAAHGWWFVQEQATLLLPLAVPAAAAAVALAAPPLVRGLRVDAAPGIAATTALFAAGYTASLGLAFPLLVGYPATVPLGLSAVGLVLLAVFVTWRTLAPVDSPYRRRGLVAAALSGLLLVSGAAVTVRSAGTDTAFGHNGGHDTPVSDLVGPDPATLPPGTAVRRYTLTARTATVRLSSGRAVAAWTFNGQAPGPTLTADQGDVIEVTLRNLDIRAGVTIHWHGYDVPGGEDGVPGLTQAAVLPGHQYVYRFRAEQTGTYWYHTHEVSDQGVRLGLYGMLVVRTPGPTAPGLDAALPIHTFAGRVALDDRDGPDIRQVPPGTSVRLRLANTDSVTHRITLSGAPYRLTAVDGTDLVDPGTLGQVTLRLAAGGRYDLTFTMPTGTVALLVDNARAAGLRLAPPGASAPSRAQDTGGWPELDLAGYGGPAPQPITLRSAFDSRFTLVLDRGLSFAGGVPRYAYTINGLAYPAVPAMVVHAGELVELTVVNRGLDTHPWHLHGHRMLILERDGRPVTGSPLWMDSVEVGPGEVVRVAFRADNPGVWMNHCHNLPHADQGMMLVLRYSGVDSPFAGGHGG